MTGIGLVTPAGIGVDESWNYVLKGESATALDPDLAGLTVDLSCRVPGFDPVAAVGPKRAWRMDRTQALAIAAARQAIEDAGLSSGGWDDARVGVVVGTGLGGMATLEAQHSAMLEKGAAKVSALTMPMFLTNMTAGQLAIEFGARGPNLTVSTACASGATAIGVARDLLRSGAADVVVAGGVDAGVTPMTVAAFTKMNALSARRSDPRTASRPFDAGRDGFVIAEGAGMVVLEHEGHARARGARARGKVVGYGASADGHHVTAPEPGGRGAENAIRTALADAGMTPADVGYINAHGTSTRLNDSVEAATIKRVFGNGPAVSSTKGSIGHTLGAAGAIEAIYSVLALEHGVAPPTANLVSLDPEIDLDLVRSARTGTYRVAMSNSFGFGGANAALLLAS
ncbi:3-oxoacyl-ACP synthase [Amycolatopsis orientalis]|uniref:3-oxoacyl-[acyl-carrier-protein] synthase 2 n=1 Tax=Amycolatopsis orientalis TaxID=31958 RepID=A0A193CBI7_AMYOR|nr:3-oxoacyl-ACP synthase [Amycolatopsis orientalis]